MPISYAQEFGLNRYATKSLFPIAGNPPMTAHARSPSFSPETRLNSQVIQDAPLLSDHLVGPATSCGGAFGETSAFCCRCRCAQEFRRVSVRHKLHLLLTVLTVGLWTVPWVMIYAGSIVEPWRCVRCGWRVWQVPIVARFGSVSRVTDG